MVKVAERIYSLGETNYGICEVCFTRYQSPIYVCPYCKVGYHALAPTVKGFFSIRCSCGHKLPVTTWGRRKFKTLCTECGNEVKYTKVPIVTIPIMGGANAGKTTFINNHMKSDAKRVGNLTTFIERFQGRVTKFMLFDTLGSDFSDSHSLKKYQYYSYNNGFIFIIDPFVTARLLIVSTQPPNYMLSDILDTLILYLQKNQGLKPGETVNKPIAFVITKTDLLAESEGTIENNEERFLRENGEELFLNKLKRTFSNYKFFCEGKDPKTQKQQVVSWITSESVH
ncbi:MAG: GTPase domain-containing protein [Clostridiaceae bacterium]|nr:GTPase domain-containing protein [Clostridiaceae bacterium]